MIRRLFVGHAESSWMATARFVAKCLAVATVLAAVVLGALEIWRPWD